MRRAYAAPGEHVGLRAIEIPTLRQEIHARVSDFVAMPFTVTEFEVSCPVGPEIGGRVEGLEFLHGAFAVVGHHGDAVRVDDGTCPRRRDSRRHQQYEY